MFFPKPRLEAPLCFHVSCFILAQNSPSDAVHPGRPSHTWTAHRARLCASVGHGHPASPESSAGSADPHAGRHNARAASRMAGEVWQMSLGVDVDFGLHASTRICVCMLQPAQTSSARARPTSILSGFAFFGWRAHMRWHRGARCPCTWGLDFTRTLGSARTPW